MLLKYQNTQKIIQNVMRNCVSVYLYARAHNPPPPKRYGLFFPLPSLQKEVVKQGIIDKVGRTYQIILLPLLMDI